MPPVRNRLFNIVLRLIHPQCNELYRRACVFSGCYVAVNVMTLIAAFAPLSVDISCSPGDQQQTRAAGEGRDGQTDGQTDGRVTV